MTKYFLPLILFASLLAGAQTTTVTGDMKNPDGTAAAGSAVTFAKFDLQYAGANQCRVSGTGQIVQTSYKVQPNASGHLSVNLYSNSSITCGTTLGNTRWNVTYYVNNVPGQSCAYNITGPTWDLNTQVCVTVAPVVTAPGGDATYGRLDGGNSPFTGDIKFNGKVIKKDPLIDIRFYGAVADGVTDNSTAIQNAINAGLTAGMCVYIPSGTWYYNTGLIGNSTSTGACIKGNGGFGSGASILKYGSSATGLAISNSGSYVYNAHLSKFAILATQNATAGIVCDTCSEFVFDEVGVVGKSDLTGKFAKAFDLRGSHTPSSNISHITNPLCQYNTTCFSLMDVSGIDIFGGDFYQNTNVFLLGSFDHVHIHGVMNAEQQEYFLRLDDTLTPSGTILADNLIVENNNIPFDGSFGTKNWFFYVKNSGTNRMNLYNALFQGNRIYCANGACATDYPFHFDVSGTTDSNTLLTPVIRNNWLNGASTGGVTSNSSKVIGQFSENQNYGVSGGLGVDVAGTVSSWLCTNNNRFDQIWVLGCNNRTSGIFASFYNAGDGATNLVIRESPNQNTVAPFTVNDSANTVKAGVDYQFRVFAQGFDANSIGVVNTGPLTGASFSAGVGQGSGLKHQRITTGSIAASSSAAVTVTWTNAFADGNYTPTCSVEDATTSISALRVHHIEAVGPSSIVVRVVNDDAGGAHTGAVACVALHD